MSTGEQPVGMDADALGKTGNEFRGSAAVIKDQAEKIANNMIAARATGHAYMDGPGKTIEGNLRKLESWLNDWSTATERTGDAIVQDVAIYSDVDRENASQTEQAAS